MEDNSVKWSLRKLLFSKISRKVFLLFFAITLFSLVILMGTIYFTTMGSLKSQIKNNIENAAHSKTDHIATYIDQDTERIKLITSRTQLRKDIYDYLANPSLALKETISQKLKDSKSSIDEIENVCFIDLSGKVVACDNELLVDQNFRNEEFFTTGKIKENAYFFMINETWKILISAPIKENGQLMGIIITTESTEELEEIIHQIEGLGETGEVLIAFLDHYGNKIYPIQRRYEEEAKKIVVDPIKTAEPTKRALKGEEFYFDNVLDYRNVEVIAATRYIPEVKLGVVAKIDKKEAIDIVRSKLIIIFSISFLFVLIISGVSSYFISKAVTKPIQSLIHGTESMRYQDYSVRMNIQSGDELEELGQSFNKTIEILGNIDKEKNQIDKAKTEFLSITSHELRSPMTPMKAQLQMILGNYYGKLNKKQIDSLKIILNNTERLDRIIVDFLEISRIEAARLKFNFTKVNLSSTVKSVAEEMKEFMPEKKIRIITKIGKIPVIEADPDRVSQVLRNLINNAIKFTPEQGSIEVSVKLNNGMLLFYVKDNGIGIPELAQRRLFEPFYQVDNMYQHKSGGTGLGLAICKGIVESQGGKIWLMSEEGKGTIFYFTVPLEPIRNMKAIRLLFSETVKYDEIIKNIFKEFLGPIGETEFENLRKSYGVTVKSLSNYLLFLLRNKILTKKINEEFKNKIDNILNKGEK